MKYLNIPNIPFYNKLQNHFRIIIWALKLYHIHNMYNILDNKMDTYYIYLDY